jgi:hypothetical protein
MKRSLLIILVLGLILAIPGLALAAAPKPPKSLCVKWGDLDDTSYLAIKSLATVSGTGAFYTIAGEHVLSPSISVPVIGTGHVNAQGVLHFSFTGAATFNPGGDCPINGTQTLVAQGTWNLASQSGTINFHWDFIGGCYADDGKSLTTATCGAVPYAGEAGLEDLSNTSAGRLVK